MTTPKMLLTILLLMISNIISVGSYQANSVTFEPKLPQISKLEHRHGQSYRGVISPFDHIMQSAAARQGLDWRLLAAIGYQESKFNSEARSPMGALGLMQVMPYIAAKFGVSADSVMIPSVNVETAIKLIKSIERSIRFEPNVTQEYKTKVVLACYNAGIGNVYDALRLAAKCGANANDWTVLESYLKIKCLPEFVNDPAVRCGKFSYTETIEFVEVVMKQYENYCNKYPV